LVLGFWNLKYLPHSGDQCLHFRLRADGDAQVFVHFRRAKPADKDLPVAQFLQPGFCRVQRRFDEDKVGLAG